MKKKLGVLVLFSLVTLNNIRAQCWKQLSAGNIHCLAIKEDSTLWAWGSNLLGALGDGTSNDSELPKQISSTHEWAMVSGGNLFSLALKIDGSIWAWGDNQYFQCGDTFLASQSISFHETPVRVGNENDWKYIHASNQTGQCYAIKNNGTLWAWGSNGIGTPLGVGTTLPYRIYTPTQVGNANNWQTISSSGWHTLALQNDNTLWTWGSNYQGECGLGNTQSYYYPIQIGTDQWKQISASPSASSYGIKTNGTLWAWGDNLFGELGNDTSGIQASINPTPQQIGNSTNWNFVLAGNSFAIGIKDNNDLWAWGRNLQGNQLDSSMNQLSQYDMPRYIGNFGLSSISCGSEDYTNGVGLNTTGSIVNWGGFAATNNNNYLVNSDIKLYVIPCNPTHVFDFTTQDLLFYPNPATTIIHLENPISVNTQFRVTNVFGQSEPCYKLDNQRIDISLLQEGLYFLIIDIEGRQHRMKFMKQNL